jgi:hypothetical protein
MGETHSTISRRHEAYMPPVMSTLSVENFIDTQITILHAMQPTLRDLMDVFRPREGGSDATSRSSTC